jgi:3-polyprenyl-4-hydroxybenzoate decarboxylase
LAIGAGWGAAFAEASEQGKKLEIAIALGVDPLIIMAAATPIPVDLSEWLFAGLYGGSGVSLAKCKTVDLEVPADSEFVLEGTITPGEVLAGWAIWRPHGLLRWGGRFAVGSVPVHDASQRSDLSDDV